MNDSDKLTEEQKQGIIDAIGEIDSGKGIPHEEVMENIRKNNQMHQQIILIFKS